MQIKYVTARKTVNTAFCLRESKKKVLHSEFQAVDCGFQVLESRFILILDAGFLENSEILDLYSGFWITLHGATEIFQEY